MLNSTLLALALALSIGQPAMAHPQKIANGEGCIATGVLSTYDDWYQGRPTASGELFDQGSDSVALVDWLPFGWYTLTNLNNGRSIRVKGNDRGDFERLGRVADASAAAFSAISDSGTTSEGLLRSVCLSN